MRLLSVEQHDLESSVTYQKFKEVYDYFEGRNDGKWQVLKILNRRPNSEKLDTIWNWVQLQQERKQLLSTLPPELLTEDINKEIENQYLTNENIKMLQEQARKRELEARMREAEKKVEKTALSEREEQDINAVAPSSVFKDMRASLEALETINQEIDNYG